MSEDTKREETNKSRKIRIGIILGISKSDCCNADIEVIAWDIPTWELPATKPLTPYKDEAINCFECVKCKKGCNISDETEFTHSENALNKSSKKA